MYHLIIRNSLPLVTLLLLSCNFSNKKMSETPNDEKHFPPKADSVLNIINLVNDHWQNSHPEPDRAFWHPAAYHTGNIEAYKVTGNERFLEYSKNGLSIITGKEPLQMIVQTGNIIMAKLRNMCFLGTGRSLFRLMRISIL